MPKKSRKRATKYSELSKARRKRQLERLPTEPKAALTQETQEKPAVKKSPAPKTMPRPQAGAKQIIPDYKYVRNDLKRIGILTAGVVIILIVLAFVLG